jgi:hypothetical protein
MAYLARLKPDFIQPGPFGPEGSYVTCLGAYAVVYDEQGEQVVGVDSQFMPMTVMSATADAQALGAGLHASLAALLEEQLEYTGDLDCEWVPLPVFPAPV